MSIVTSVEALSLSVSALATARRADFSDSELAVYIDLLADIDPVLVDRACRQLGKQPRERYEPAMPDVPKIRQVADQIASDDRAALRRSKLLPAPDDRDARTHVFCRGCQDTGWVSLRCPGISAPNADRDRHLAVQLCTISSRAHAGHTYAERCSCLDINPVIARRRDATRAPAA